jgi:hypothetical protein
MCLLAGFGIDLLATAGQGYDDGGIGGVAFLLNIIWSVLAFPFSGASELLFSLNGGRGIPGHLWVVVAIGVTVCAIADIVLQFIRKGCTRSAAA